MEKTLGEGEFTPEGTYLNTSVSGLLPARAAAAVGVLTRALTTGRHGGPDNGSAITAARRSFAGIAHVPEDRVAIGSSVAVHVALVAQALPPGAEVLFPEGEYSSVVTPFTVRGDLRVRYAPLEALADAVRPGTALVAFSTVQSADGRIADSAAVREAAAAHGARTLADASQSAGWLPLAAGDWDYTVTAAYKFLLCPRGVSFLTVGEDAQDSLVPIHAGPSAGERQWTFYGPVEDLAPSARRYDETPATLPYHAAGPALALLEEIGIDAVHAHATGLARRFREGLTALGHRPLPGDSAIVAVPGLGGQAAGLARGGVAVSARAGNLRAAFHLYNSAADVDRALDALAALTG
ncbi:aminotransferase class V-fold PLP-dependent enzyme [Streptomyces clavuligerus]|nr:aminotransferase class V-fold PLP-dependent enzyme [Streptomyces clavuligerus]ANW20802.1 class V aminotransferase [Streptomyces clavuligerus]AXU15428.1 aminotransferase class V-fold PLP-dependent enzyme [Streptomyces clavuligerus]MBY6305522.1 aminotransferase class V-fold PLP-dependent enzyme [Streptomyces clavuligerus]QCS08204.1 aminotransferase class V-fold PLP-dependent enzyme [Streptomyces clavuligerus]QPJ92458.1 aminotransferase class V-fold PLP-dependent enzyme [Streptomyces clavulige